MWYLIGAVISFVLFSLVYKYRDQFKMSRTTNGDLVEAFLFICLFSILWPLSILASIWLYLMREE